MGEVYAVQVQIGLPTKPEHMNVGEAFVRAASLFSYDNLSPAYRPPEEEMAVTGITKPIGVYEITLRRIA